jgi:sarcosine oxidase subunit alpha
MQRWRLDTGGRIDRSRPLRFRFDGREYEGYAGDTLASALLANGVRVVGRSFKLRRPRGIVGCGAEEPNAIVQVGEGAQAQPNLRATQVELYPGLVARSTRGWPNARFDAASGTGWLSPVLGAGFYYKTFMRPRFLWPLYERALRASAGFGRAPDGPDPARYRHRNAHCDVLVAGGGPAGLMAALAAARAGARVIVADEQAEFGGSLLGAADAIDGRPAPQWLDDVLAELAAAENVVMLPRSTVFGYHDHNFLTIARHGAGTEYGWADSPVDGLAAADDQELWRVRARRVVLAQGAIERPLTFCNNDRPGVMLASAVSTYLRRYAVRPGESAVVFTNNDSAYRTALDLNEAGVEVLVVDSRAGGAGERGRQAESTGIAVLRGYLVINVSGGRRLRTARLAKWRGDPSTLVEGRLTIDCDLLAMSGGWSPAVHLHSQAGGAIGWDDGLQCFVPGRARQAHVSAGAGNGKTTLAECLADGVEAGRQAAADCGFETGELSPPPVDEPAARPLEALWRVPGERDPDRGPKAFLDLQNDTSVADIRLAVREGYRSIEHVKRYTALGFGTDQGKLGNINGMAVVAECLGKTLPEVGTTTFRPPYTPVRLGLLAGETRGDLYDPVRKTALHEWHEAAGAPMEVVGQWHRPHYFPQTGEDLPAAVARECRAVRSALGVMDASTLGKIDVRGPDAARFLDRIYTHDVGRMKAGRCSYALMLREDGTVFDDGVVARLGEQQFYLTTTTGGAAAVLAWLESWLQTEWPDLEVYLTSLTEALAAIAVAGPNCRALLRKLGCGIGLDGGDFPFMSHREGELAGVPVRLLRVSFSGELAYEIHVDSGYALALWRRIMDAGAEYGITPYGTEAMHVLRAEKGYVIVGQDTDGSVSLEDLGLNWLLSSDKDFLGKRSLARPDNRRGDRKQLVGLRPSDGETVLPEGTQLVEDPAHPVPVPMCGHVTSSYRSAVLGHPIALALVAGGRTRHGETVHAMLPGGKALPVQIVSPVCYDAAGERQKGAGDG